MMLNDWLCTNEKCESKEKIELFRDNHEEDPKCERCGETMMKIIGGPKAKHISWSKWRI